MKWGEGREEKEEKTKDKMIRRQEQSGDLNEIWEDTSSSKFLRREEILMKGKKEKGDEEL